MARKKGFSGLANDMARASARTERERQVQQKAQQRELEKKRRESVRFETQMLKDEKQRYLESRLAETEDTNFELQTRVEDLSTILEFTLNQDDTISFLILRSNEIFRQFRLPAELENVAEEPKLEAFQSRVVKPSGISKLVPGTTKKYEEALKLAEAE